MRNKHIILLKFTSNFTDSKKFNLHHYLCFIIVQHPWANKRNFISILLFFDIRTYWTHTYTQIKTFAHHPQVNQFILFTTQFNVPWTRWSNTGLFAYLANRQDKGPVQEPSHLNPTPYLRFLKDKNVEDLHFDKILSEKRSWNLFLIEYSCHFIDLMYDM